MTFRTGLLKAIDRVRGIPNRLDLRLYKVSIRVRTWTGSRPGVDSSTSTDADEYFGVDAGTHRARVAQVTQRDIIASGGIYQDQDVKVGPITPPYLGGAANHADITAFDPNPTGSATEVFFKIEGPGMATGGSWFHKVGQDCSKPFAYYFTLRRVAQTP